MAMIMLDYRDKRPIYEQVVAGMARAIAGGVLEADEKLPSVRSMALELDVNPNTVQRAYADLERQGYIYTISGRGNFVSPRDQWQSVRQDEVLRSFDRTVADAFTAGVEQAVLEDKIAATYGGRDDD